MSRNQVRKPIVQFVCLAVGLVAFLASSGAAFGQTTGKVIGTVTDQDTGQPLIGAQVVVEGTNLGNVTNQDGYYFINNVPVGIERVTAQYLGYQTTTEEERILAGQTMTVDFALSSEVVQAEGIVAVIEIAREEMREVAPGVALPPPGQGPLGQAGVYLHRDPGARRDLLGGAQGSLQGRRPDGDDRPGTEIATDPSRLLDAVGRQAEAGQVGVDQVGRVVHFGVTDQMNQGSHPLIVPGTRPEQR